MQNITISHGATIYVFAHTQVPIFDELPWHNEECDAFVVVLAEDVLVDELAKKVSLGLASLRTNWVEIMGPRSEYIHDLVDLASVANGRQERIGDGDPMTAWHDDLDNMDAMAAYVRLGGHGSTNNKLVVVIGHEGDAAAFARQLKNV